MVPAARGRGEVGRCGAARELVAKSSLAPLPSPAADGSVATRRGRRPWAWVPHPQVSRTAPVREVEGAPPRIERVLALACGSERRTDRRPTPLAAVSAGRTAGTRGCILPPPLDLPPAASQVRGGHAQPYVRTRRGHPAKERRGPRGVDMHGQAAPTHKGPAAYLGSSWTAARFSHASSDAGEATWSPPLALSPLGKRSVRR